MAFLGYSPIRGADSPTVVPTTHGVLSFFRGVVLNSDPIGFVKIAISEKKLSLNP